MTGAVRGGRGLSGDVQSWIDALADWAVELGFKEMQTEIYFMRETHPSLLDNVPPGRTSCSL